MFPKATFCITTQTGSPGASRDERSPFRQDHLCRSRFSVGGIEERWHLRMYWIDPLRDLRWATVVARHPQGSVFHTLSWLEALRRTYGYRSILLTSRPPGEELVDGIPFCEVKSCISGSRLVSLPFSDHCEPLLQRSGDLADFIACLCEQYGRSTWKYIEIRPVEVP